MKAIKKNKEVKSMTIRIPLSLWKTLRRLEEISKIKSIQEATIRGLEWIIKQ